MIRERPEVLRSIESMAESISQDARWKDHSGVKQDVILDALAAALTAAPGHTALRLF